MQQTRRSNHEAKCGRLAWSYHNAQQDLKAQQAEMDRIKQELDPMLEEYFDDSGSKVVAFSSLSGDDRLVVRKVERTTIEWDAAKLEKRVPKDVARRVIKKHYHIDNMPGLIEYLKYCGVDPNIFKQYIRAEKYVDQKEVDRLSELGMISVRNISGCYRVKCQKPYFTFKVKKGDGDGED